MNIRKLNVTSSPIDVGGVNLAATMITLIIECDQTQSCIKWAVEDEKSLFIGYCGGLPTNLDIF